jgi:DNA repair protein RadC
MLDGLSERLSQFGPSAMSDAELLAVVTGTNAEVARGILDAVGSLHGISNRRPTELAALPGMTGARADRLLMAIELGKRATSHRDPGKALMTPADVQTRFQRIATDHTEQFIAVALNARNRVTGEWVVARGWESGVNLTPRQVMTLLVKEGVGRCLFVHNHPSGDPIPSPEDVRFTRRMLDAAKTLDIKVLDHVIVASGGFASMRESARGELEFG